METADTTYGSDKRGVVWAYLIGADQPASLVDATSAAGWLAGSGEAETKGFPPSGISCTASVPGMSRGRQPVGQRPNFSCNTGHAVVHLSAP